MKRIQRWQKKWCLLRFNGYQLVINVECFIKYRAILLMLMWQNFIALLKGFFSFKKTNKLSRLLLTFDTLFLKSMRRSLKIRQELSNDMAR